MRPAEKEGRSWDEVPENIKRTFDRLGIPEAEQKFLAGAGAQYDSEMVYHRVREELEAQGVIFKSIEAGLREHEDLFREYFGTVIPATDNKYAALNAAVWSGGSFIYVPPGVEIKMPLQAYFRLNTANIGQFERTLIIVDEGAFLHYVEGCTAPTYSTESLHSGVIEIIVKRGARSRYTTIQNWSDNVYNLVTQRAMVYGDATHEWVDANMGSKITMKYPSVYLMEPGAHGEILSIAFAGRGQIQDAGGKAIHVAAYHQPDPQQVDCEGRRPQQLSRSAEGVPGSEQLQEHGRLRRPAARRVQRVGHLSVHRDRSAGCGHRARGNGQQDR